MWQRRGNKAPTISQPTQFTQLDQDNYYDYDERYLETIPEVESISSRRQSALVVLPDLPFRAVPPMTDIPQPVNLNSYQSPTTNYPAHRGLRINVHVQGQQPSRDEVSPLTPHESHAIARSHDDRPVSPIEPVVPALLRIPQPERPFQSQIPRKKVKASEGSASETKWDEYSGEPTTDGRGKPASVRPGTQPVEMQYPHLKERTKQILAGLREREATKNTPWGRTPPPVAADPLDQPPQREPWRGASGRAAIVEPVKNTPSARQGPLRHLERKTSHPSPAQTPVEHDSLDHWAGDTSSPDINHSPAEQMAMTQAPFTSPALRSVDSEEEIKPVAPLKPGRRIRTPELVTKTITHSPVAQSPPVSPEPLLHYQESVPEVAHPRVESPQYEEEPRTPTSPVPSDNTRIMDKVETPTAYGPADLDREQSRFSWTTYTTSNADSPRSTAQAVRGASPPPPMPDLPHTINIKKRPVSSSPFMHSSPYARQSYADSNASVIRKPLPGVGPRTSSLSAATSRAMSTSKSLPPTPTILEASDKIENLDAQLEALNRRKHNISRIISDLEGSLKKNAVVYDMWKRKELEKNITNHKLELDDIGREVHEISIRLHRAQRKRDKEDGYEACTGLWIKRVTS